MPAPRPSDAHLTYPAQLQEYEVIVDRIVREASVRPAGPVLDWGCGHGHVSSVMLARGLEVRSIDYWGEAATESEVTLPKFPEVQAFTTAEPVRLPYEDGTFGAVLSCGVLEHVQEPPASLDELHRVLKPGGRLYVYKLPNRTSYLELIARRSGRMHYHGQSVNDTIYTESSARELVAAHGYRVEEVSLANMLPLTVGGAPARRFARGLWKANVALARVPGLRQLATNVDLIATRL